MPEPLGYLFHVGAIGWEHPEWEGKFYPLGLPPDWRLAYYNQFFDCVYVPYGRWSRASTEELTQWREDTLPRFRFVLEAGSGALTWAEQEKIGALGERAGLIHYPQDAAAKILWLAPDADLKVLAQRLAALAEGGAEAYLICRSPDAAFMEKVGTLLQVLGL